MADDLGRPLRRTSPSVVESDPFWAAVRERHPGATLVLLPPELPGDEPPPVPLAEARDAVRAARRAWEVAAPVLEEYGDPGSPSVGWRSRPGGRALVTEAGVRGIGVDAGAAALREIAARLDRDDGGWRFDPGSRNGHPLLRATDGHAELRAEAGPGATVLTVATRPMAVAGQDRALLVEEAGSWR
ncbi:hypothetical protein [Nocardioides panacisoli]|uniref:Uncharacterized protein n=1 Tax=Nocardioides panacisoli TaxID=627624 RepID=A0ABP7HXG2_9ACTN